jgi:hypothetical protein
MGKLTRRRYAALDALIERKGEDWMHEVLMLGISEGASHADLSCRLSAEADESIPWYIIRGWIEANCAEDVALAYRARADILADAADRTVNEATMEQLGVDRLKVDHYTKQAAKLDRVKYGDGEFRGSVGGVGGITIVIGSVTPQGLEAPQEGEVYEMPPSEAKVDRAEVIPMPVVKREPVQSVQSEGIEI